MRRLLVLAMLLPACGPRVFAPRLERSGARLVLEACRPVRSIGDDTPLLVLGGARDDQTYMGWMLTLGDGDGVLVNDVYGEGRRELSELSWWSNGACVWRAALDRRSGTMVAAHDTVWVTIWTDGNGPRWSEIDAGGNVRRTLTSPMYVNGLLPRADGSLTVLGGTLDERALWRVGDQSQKLADVPLPAGGWSFGLAPAGEGTAILATSWSDTYDPEPEELAPRLVIPGVFDTTVAFHRASTSAIAELPEGGWLVALGPGFGSEVVTAVRIDRDGHVLWRSLLAELGDVRVGNLDPGGAIGLSVRGDAGWQPRRLLVDLESGALTLADSARGHGWSVGAVGDAPVEGVSIPRERYWVEARHGCNDIECSTTPGHLAVAGALYVLPPTAP